MCADADGNDDKAGPGEANMKQQGWLSKIVPQPKRSHGPMSARRTAGTLGGFGGGEAHSYDEISMPSKFHFQRFGAIQEEVARLLPSRRNGFPTSFPEDEAASG